MKFSDRLKGLREKNDMTQEQLAKVSGVSPRTIQRYECGTSRPRLDAAEKLTKHGLKCCFPQTPRKNAICCKNRRPPSR